MWPFERPDIERLKENKNTARIVRALSYKRDWKIREQAALALGEFPSDEAIEALKGALEDENENVWRAAEHALSRIVAPDEVNKWTRVEVLRRKQEREDTARLADLVNIASKMLSTPKERDKALSTIVHLGNAAARYSLAQLWLHASPIFVNEVGQDRSWLEAREYHHGLRNSILNAAVRAGDPMALYEILQADWGLVIHALEALDSSAVASGRFRLAQEYKEEGEALQNGRSMGRAADTVAALLRSSPEIFSSEVLNMLKGLKDPQKVTERVSSEYVPFMDPDMIGQSKIFRYLIDYNPLRTLALAEWARRDPREKIVKEGPKKR